MSNLPELFVYKLYELASHGLVGWVVGWRSRMKLEGWSKIQALAATLSALK